MNSEICRAITEFVAKHKSIKGTTWRTPVIGFADASNPKFAQLKNLVSQSHAMPDDLMPNAKSVIVFFLPFSEEIVTSNIGEFQSSVAWDIANIETNNLISELNIMINEFMKAHGHDSTILPATYNYDEKLLLSDWSHRHVAHIAGVGTFGINNMLITERGCCGRLGSVITTMPLTPTATLTEENCLFKRNGSCGVCAKKCVAHAISTDSGYPYVNRDLCNKQVYDDAIPEYDIGLGDACGKCMSGVPCSLKNPCANI